MLKDVPDTQKIAGPLWHPGRTTWTGSDGPWYGYHSDSYSCWVAERIDEPAPVVPEFRYFTDKDGSRWKMPTDNSRGFYWSKKYSRWIDQPTNLSGILMDVKRDGTIETDATGAPLVEPASDTPLSTWQPIESAPRDGTLIDLWVPGEFASRWTDCYFGMPPHECGEAGPYCDSDWHGSKPGWVDSTFGEVLDMEPTHWMPLPQPPTHPRQ